MAAAGQLGTAINTKADEVWLKSLEEQIREEMDKMRKKTGGKVKQGPGCCCWCWCRCCWCWCWCRRCC